MNYLDFLKSKIQLAPESGFAVEESELSTALKPHQKASVMWALRGGRRALFQSFGLGKTVEQLEFCRLVVKHQGGRALIVLPLGVRQEFTRDAVELLGMAPPVYITHQEHADLKVYANGGQIFMTNYERVRDGDIDPKAFAATSLDEASVLRSFGSKTYQTFLDKFKGVKYKLVNTATPSPNKYKELIHYAGYLEVMDTGQALTRFFQRDSTKANNLTLYPHKEDEFWLWVSSWALVLTRPSDLGFDDTGYDLPPLEVRTHIVTEGYGNSIDRDGQVKLLNDAAASLIDAAREKRDSIDLRVAQAKRIVDSDPDAHFILWHDLEAERHAIKAALPDTVDIYGTMDYDERERRVIDFAEGRCRLFATKKSLSGSGCNFQRHCHRAIFVGIDYEFNDFIQAIHRIYRFLQTEQVIIDIIFTEAEEPIYRALMAKWEQHEHMQERMREIVKKYGLNAAAAQLVMARSIGVDRVEVKGQNWTAVNNDCVEETGRMGENSVDLICTSIPFSNHYEYTPSYNDFGHNEDTAKFFEQMDYLTPNLLRILKPGRVFACHVKDRVLFGNATGMGMPTMEPFHAMCIRHYMDHGFAYFGMITVVTDVVRENNQTYRLGWTEQCKDGSKMGVGCPEYILLFRKLPTDRSKAYADEPVNTITGKYTGGLCDPLMVPVTLSNTGGSVGTDAASPVHTIRTAGGQILVTPSLMCIGQTGGGDRIRDVREPVPTAVSKQEACLAAASLIQYHTEQTENVRASGLGNPIQTIDASNRYGLTAAQLVEYYGNGNPLDVQEPMHTVTSHDREAVVAAHVVKFKGTNLGSSPADPVQTVTAGAGQHRSCGGGNFAVCKTLLCKVPADSKNLQHWPEIRALLNKHCGYELAEDDLLLLDFGGALYYIADIGLRMLTPRELYKAMGFPDDYKIETDYKGNPYPKNEQVARCGNAVCPPLAAAVARANLPEWARKDIKTMEQLEQAVAV